MKTRTKPTTEGVPEGTPLYAYQARIVLGVTAETLRIWTAADAVPHKHIGTVKVKYPCAADLREWFKSEAFASLK